MMFGFQFFFSGRYQKLTGSSIRNSMMSSYISGICGIVILLIINGFSISFTPFTVLMAALSAINSMAFSACSIFALNKINLSLYSVFSMIGGMALPFAAGILFFDEKMTVAKGICVVLLVTGMCFTVEKYNNSREWWFYIGIFVFNGMSGVLSLLFNRLPFEKASAADYSMISTIIRILMSLTVLIFLPGKHQMPGKRAFGDLALCGVLGTVANFLLLISLSHVPSSMQYPLVTGGVMVISTIISFFTSRKPRRKDIISVSITFAGMLALLLPF